MAKRARPEGKRKPKTSSRSQAKSLRSPRAMVPVVGLGASAGGLRALKSFFSALNQVPDLHAAFVVVQHLSVDHESHLVELLQNGSRLHVCEAADAMPVQPNCVYVIPAGRDLALVDGVFRLSEPAMPQGLRLPIDFFLRSLAAAQQHRAIGIILSGTGSDGVLGARAIKAEGGFLIAQDASAEHAEMPKHTIETRLVDCVLAPEDMPARLVDWLALDRSTASRTLAESDDESIAKIFAVLRARTRHDFSQYKRNTVSRRIERRMVVQQIDTLASYVRFIQQTPEEAEALFRELLIGVTCFFRDASVFRALEQSVIPRLFVDKVEGSTIRVWVPSVATGEEAYSLAILLQEHLDTLDYPFKLQIFATDIDGRAILHARRGLYPASIAADVSPARLQRFFVAEPDGSGFRVNKIIRDLLIFSEQDVLREPPFSRIDLISCRNLLIYLGPELQRKIIPMFHYALNPKGFLLLGTSETVGDFVDLFATVDRAEKIYQRKEDLRHAPHHLLDRAMMLPTEPPLRPSPRATSDPKSRLRALTEAALLQAQAAVGVLIDARGEILYVHGRSWDYLEPAIGEASLNILKMAREGLRRELVTSLRELAAGKTTQQRRGLKMPRAGSSPVFVDLTVRPVQMANEGQGAGTSLYLVILEPSRASKKSERAPSKSRGGKLAIESLRNELRAKEEFLHAANEQLESSNEALQSSNEAMQSMNEELQSANEELETSKEELQSVNEELSTVNAELQQKLIDLSRTNNDMSNLLAGTGIGTVFVDHTLRIQRYTPAAAQVINLIPTDVGRPIAHTVSNLIGYDGLVADTRNVLDSLVPKEITVQSTTGVWYSVRIRPYRTTENVIEGAVISFFDISDLKQAQDAVKEGDRLRRLAGVALDARDAMIVVDLHGRILGWNPGAARMYGWSDSEAENLSLSDVTPAHLREGELARLLELAGERSARSLETQRVTKAGAVVDVASRATALIDQRGNTYGLATSEREIE